MRRLTTQQIKRRKKELLHSVRTYVSESDRYSQKSIDKEIARLIKNEPFYVYD